MNVKLKRFLDALSSVLVTLVVTVAVFLAVTRLIGLRAFPVLSEAMEPSIPAGSIVFTRSVEAKTLAEGDVITYILNEDTVETNQIVEILYDEKESDVIRFKMKGDVDGAAVHCKNVLGVPKFSIPYFGYAATFIQHAPGSYIAVSVGILLLFLIFIPGILTDEWVKEQKKDDTKKQL